MTMVADRKEARSALHTLLLAELTSAFTGYKYAPASFEGASPIFYISGSGSNLTPLTGRGGQVKYYLNVHLLALYASNATYTEEVAEDTLDMLESQLRQAIGKNRKTTQWQDIRYAGRSAADDPLQVGGELYLHEIVPIVMEVY